MRLFLFLEEHTRTTFHCLFPSILKMWEASHKMKAIYYIIYRKWNIKKTTWDLDYLDKIQSSEQWTEENCIKSGRLLKHVAKYPLKIPPTKTIRHGRKGQVLWQEFPLILTLKNNAHKARNNTFKCSWLSLRSVRESGVTRRLSNILKWLLFFLSFVRRLKNFLSSNSAAIEWSLFKGQSYVQKHLFFPTH